MAAVRFSARRGRQASPGSPSAPGRSAPPRSAGPRPLARLAGILAALTAIAALAAPLTPAVAVAEPRTVVVGVYENEPKVFTDANGRPAGIFVDLVEAIAAKEGWTLVYRPGEWSEDLAALDDGRIDLMPDVAYSLERDKAYDFHRTPVTQSWSHVYAAPGENLEIMSQLDGKRVAVLEGSIQETVFAQLMTGYGYDVTFVPVDSLKEAFAAARDGSADAAIANHLFGDYFYRDYRLDKTSIVFNPVPLYYATAQGKNPDLLEAIDADLSAWMEEPDSPYYEVLTRWTAEEPRTRVPAYVYWALGVGGGLLLLVSAIMFVLRWQVAVKTRHLEEAREAHRAAEEKLRLALDAADEGIWEWRPKSGEFTWSDRCYTMLGWHPGEFAVDEDVLDKMTHPDDRDSTLSSAREQMTVAGATFSIEYRLMDREGGWRWMHSRGRAVASDRDGAVDRAIGTTTDVTERKSAELELRRHRDHLEELVEERTRELLDASAAKNRFLARMSHELRTPLNSIIGFSSLLSKETAGPLNGEQQSQVEAIHTSGRHLLTLIDAILDLSQAEASKVKLHHGTVEPAQVMAEATDAIRPLAAEKGLELSAEAADSVPAFRSDPGKIRQILLNLLGNAVKFTETGRVGIRLERDGDEGIAFVVSDTGPGIPADELPLVFEAFYQAEAAEGTVPKGTGLGLAISREYAQLLGGEISATSELGEGSVFTLRLPI